MAAARFIPIILKVDDRDGQQAVRRFLDEIDKIDRHSERAASGSSGHFTKFLGADFFGGLARDAFHAFTSRAQTFVNDSIRLATEARNAWLGVGSVAKFAGVDDQAAQRAVQNLRLVRGGVLSVAEGASALKNLLPLFGLDKSVALIERFSDTAAFGKQAALSYGEAIVGATEGIKNQNSVLVDNVGLTKNLSVILKERGFTLEDLTDKTKKSAAAQALYNGLLEESRAQVGDADKLMTGYTATVAAQDMAYQNLQKSVGDIITTNPLLQESNRIVTEQINAYTAAINTADSDTNKFGVNAVSTYAKLQAAAIPALDAVMNGTMAVASAVATVPALVAGAAVRAVEIAAGAVWKIMRDISGTFINPINTMLEWAGSDKRVPTLPEADFKIGIGGEQIMRDVLKLPAEMNEYWRKAKEAGNSVNRVLDRLNNIGRNDGWDDPYAERARRNQQGGEERARANASDASDAGGGTGGGKRTGGRKSAEAGEMFKLSDFKAINELYKEITGRNLPVTAFGQSDLHNRWKLKHQNSVDVGLHPNSADGAILRRVLDALGMPYRAFTEEHMKRGMKITGPHFHIGGQRGMAQTEASAPGNELVSVKDASGNLLYFVPKSAVENFAARARQSMKTERPVTDGPAGGVMGVEGLFKTARMTSPDDLFVGAFDERIYGPDGLLSQLALRQRNVGAEADAARWQTYVEWQHKALDVTVDLARAEESLSQFRAQAADDQLTDQRRLLQVRDEELSLLQRKQALEDEAATMGANSALRQQVAAMEEIVAIRRADVEAVEDQIRAQVRLADGMTVHTEQVRARVLDHLASQKSMTEAWADGLTGTYDQLVGFLDRGIERITGGVRLLDSLLKSIVRQLTSRLFEKFLDALTGRAPTQQQAQGGRGGGFSLSNFLGSIFRTGGGSSSILTGGFGGGGGGAVFTGSNGSGFTGLNLLGPGGGSFFGDSFYTTGRSITPPASLSDQAQQQSAIQTAVRAAAEGGQGRDLMGRIANSSVGRFLFGGDARFAQTAISAMLLGGGLGMGVGGQSRGGQILGTTGGVITSYMATLIGTAAYGSAGMGLGGALAALTPLGIAALAAGPALLLGAFLLNRNARERRDERTRNELSHNTGQQIWQLIGQAQSPRGLTVAEAQRGWNEIRTNYFNGIQGLRGRARRHAELQWTNDFQPLWRVLEQNARESEDRTRRRSDISSQLIPTFNSGGGVWGRYGDGGLMRSDFAALGDSYFRGRVPGHFDRRDDKLIRVSGDEVVLTPQQWQPIRPYLKAAKVPGFEAGGSVAPVILPAAPSAAPSLKLELHVNATGDAENPVEVVKAVLKSADGKELIAQVVDADIHRNPSRIPASIQQSPGFRPRS